MTKIEIPVRWQNITRKRNSRLQNPNKIQTCERSHSHSSSSTPKKRRQAPTQWTTNFFADRIIHNRIKKSSWFTEASAVFAWNPSARVYNGSKLEQVRYEKLTMLSEGAHRADHGQRGQGRRSVPMQHGYFLIRCFRFWSSSQQSEQKVESWLETNQSMLDQFLCEIVMDLIFDVGVTYLHSGRRRRRCLLSRKIDVVELRSRVL